MHKIVLTAENILTSKGLEQGYALEIDARLIGRLGSVAEIGHQTELLDLGEGTLMAGFIDIQVNGGGGVLFNDAPSVATLEIMGKAHAKFGTTGFLPTLISDDLSKMEAALAAVDTAITHGVPGVLGIHLEGPFLAPQRHGIHDQAKFLKLKRSHFELLTRLRSGITLLTVAPEQCEPDMIRALVDAGVVVALGHTDTTYESATACFQAGARGVTHLFNAMSQWTGRAPGAVGATLDNMQAWASIIADNRHVHDASIRIAAKALGEKRLVLITDSMSAVGTEMTRLTLFGQEILVHGESCVALDGTLAGSNLTMLGAVRNFARVLDISFEAAAAFASKNPALAIGLDGRVGELRSGLQADLIHYVNGQIKHMWIAGQPIRL